MSYSGQRALQVLEPGVQATVQDYPGRTGMLRQGFFPSGAMDYLALQVANLLVGNPRNAAGIEVALGGFSGRLENHATVAVCGAETEVTLDGETLEPWSSRPARSGAELQIGISPGPGFRSYIAISGGIDVPELFGSRATYTMGGVGGLDGRPLQAGDWLPLGSAPRAGARRLSEHARPEYASEWEIEVMRGPQATPDYLTEQDMQTLFSRSWKVDRNSDRTGIRLESYRFEWERSTGGVAGGHPSNILDNPYPVGAVNINGDLPVILGPDGPTAGGFIVAATVVRGAFWKLGQLRPTGNHVRFREVSLEEALKLDQELSERLTDANTEEA